MKLINLLVFALFLGACTKDIVPPIQPEQDEPYQIVTVESDWFNVSYVEPKTYVIEEPQSYEGNVSYLILGTNKAIMFDTGTGENPPVNGTKIKHVLNQLTSLPITLLLSHFHYDHNQNISEFDWIGFPDLSFLQQNASIDSLYTFTSQELIYGNYPAQAHIDEWMPVNTDIDLGDRIIQLVNIQGHTNESVALIDKTNKLAFLGDYLYNGSLYLFSQNDLVLYEQSVDYLISILDSNYKLYGAHGAPEIQFEKLQTLKDFLQCIDSGTCTSTSTTVEGFPAQLYSYQGMQIVVFQ